MNKGKKYIGLIHDELNDNFTVGYNISSNLEKMLEWKEEMLNCSSVEDCKVFEIKEITSTPTKDTPWEKKRSYMVNAMKEREFNYYFDKGTDVTIDGNMPLPDGDIPSFYPPDLKNYVGKKGTVIKVTKDLHAFGQGTVYFMDIDFDDKIMKDISATLIIPYLKDE